MDSLDRIQSALYQAARRRRLQQALLGMWKGFFCGILLWVLSLIIYKLAPIPFDFLVYSGITAAIMTLVGFIWGWNRPQTLLQTARWMDLTQNTEERLSTALELKDSSIEKEWKELLVKDAVKVVDNLDIKKGISFSLPRVSRWAFLLLLLGFGLGFVPEYRTKAYVQEKKDVKNIQETGKQLAELTRRSLQQRPPAMEPTRKALENVAELGEVMAKTELTRSEALKDLANMSDKLKQETREMADSPAMKALEKAAKSSSKGGSGGAPDLQKQIDKLSQQLGNQAANPDALEKFKKDLEQAKELAQNLPDKNSPAMDAAKEKLEQALADLSKQSKDMGMSLPSLDEAIAALQQSDIDEVLKDLAVAEVSLEKMRDMAKTLEKLQMQMEKLGTDLAEQLKNGQAEAAQNTLAKMAEQLQSSKLTPEQLQKMLEEVSKATKPASEYGKVGELLKQAASEMQAGQKSEASKSLAQAGDELSKMISEMGDAQSILASLEALQRAQMSIANGQSWSNSDVPGMNSKSGQGNGQPGRGVGTWTDEDSWVYPEFTDKWDNSGITQQEMEARAQTDRGDGGLADNLVATKVKGQMTPGGPMPSITMKGVSIKGTSKVAVKEMVGAAQSDAQAALSQDQVPRAYQGAVRDYFNDLKE
ncbi:MAG: hypothetical protein SFY81_14430 [Verrucomicrobiota bacterium]|nr:hypothetical protein [Verrucomicrobiota bacterium]